LLRFSLGLLLCSKRLGCLGCREFCSLTRGHLLRFAQTPAFGQFFFLAADQFGLTAGLHLAARKFRVINVQNTLDRGLM